MIPPINDGTSGNANKNGHACSFPFNIWVFINLRKRAGYSLNKNKNLIFLWIPVFELPIYL